MNAGIVIEKVHQLPHDLDFELMDAAMHEGFTPLGWLREQWLNGTNQFAGPGEGLFTARDHGRLVAVCGLNRDPCDKTGSSGRLRRLYVLPAMRRQGIGCRLVAEVLEASRDSFEAVNLRTLDGNSAVFFEKLGFNRVDGLEGATHRKVNG